MQLIDQASVQRVIEKFKDQDLYIHLEMTTGAYASHNDQSKFTASTFISNGMIRYSLGSIEGSGPFRVGLKIDQGWVYSQGLTHWEENDEERLILAGHDNDGKLVVSLQLSKEPF
ncbi:YojF family protein [Paenibacillus sp. FA6]|uniref:YojF family protein n=1 Tax=Paenibacillus sp. FA6 TaxID=3413029 RepID=UPI003F65D952